MPREFFAEVRFQMAAAPDSFHENGFEGEGSQSRIGLYHGSPAVAGYLITDCGFQIGQFVGRFCERH